MIRRVLPLLLLAAAGPLAAQSSQFGVRGLGLPLRPLSVRGVATGGSLGMFDAESSLNPASIGLVSVVTANFQTVQNWRRSESPFGSYTARDNRYPGVIVSGPVGGTRLAIAVSMSGYADRNYSLTNSDTLTLRGQQVATYDTLTSHGGLSDLRAAVAWRQSATVQWGLGFHLLTGSNRLDSRRYFSDTLYVGARERSTISYLGFGVSAGGMARLGRRVTLSGMVRFDNSLKVDRDTFDLGRTDLPVTLGGGLRVQASDRLLLAASGLWKNWSVADADLVRQGGIGAANTTEFNAGLEYLPDPRRPYRRPIRVGFRRAQLPFALERGTAVHETGVSLGTAVRFVNDRAGFDFALERVWRKAGPRFSETATLFTMGISLRP